MTTQISEILYFENERYTIDKYPLSQYPDLPRKNDFHLSISACWRGYIGTWEIIKNKLYLVRLSGHGDFTMEKLFPGKDKVFAYWFTGEISLPVRELLNYDLVGYSSRFFNHIFLDIKCGILVMKHSAVDKCNIIHNSGELSIRNNQLN